MSKHFSRLFERDNKRCVYCGRDLMVDFEIFMLTQEDHLDPASKHRNHDHEDLVIACYVCNKLKSDYTPGFVLTAANREQYMAAVRDRLMERRSKWMKDFSSWTHSPSGLPQDIPDEHD